MSDFEPRDLGLLFICLVRRPTSLRRESRGFSCVGRNVLDILHIAQGCQVAGADSGAKAAAPQIPPQPLRLAAPPPPPCARAASGTQRCPCRPHWPPAGAGQGFPGWGPTVPGKAAREPSAQEGPRQGSETRPHPASPGGSRASSEPQGHRTAPALWRCSCWEGSGQAVAMCKPGAAASPQAWLPPQPREKAPRWHPLPLP